MHVEEAGPDVQDSADIDIYIDVHFQMHITGEADMDMSLNADR